MKILVFSDSHGKYTNIRKAADMHPDAQYILHLGDGAGDLALACTASQKTYTVNGNLEDMFYSCKNNPSSQCIEIEGKRIFMCHGHRQNVNFGLLNLQLNALENDADVALFGHTH
ncbi:MAG: YfcE family phosphodiesterase, partial [Clostridia bacterium]|nr:YfcE family phosphodiesterase [Clostridia bacterium]